MKQNKILIIIIALAISLIMIAGCKPTPIIGGDKDEHGCLIAAGYSWCDAKQKCLRTWEENCTTEQNLGIANPASVYCETNGGTLEIVNEVDGQKGICTLQNGTKCEEWAYFRGECPVNKECAECPQLTPPGPQFCKTGNIIAGETDECGCTGAPKCEQVMCTADAKICPDGTGVGRIPPDCEFAQCP
jgi:putative hemolysin